MSFRHACFERRSMKGGTKPPADNPMVDQEPLAPSGDDSGRLLRQSYACQAILVAASDLLDAAMEAETIDDALELARTVKVLRERIDAIATRALQKADQLCES